MIMWISQVLSVLSVIERIIPVVERFLPGHGAGAQKAEIVTSSAQAVAATTLPGVNMQDPHIAALVAAKIAADVALANALQAAASTSMASPGAAAQP